MSYLKTYQYYHIEYQYIIRETISFPNENCPGNSPSTDGAYNWDNTYNSDNTNTNDQICPETLENIFHYGRIIRYEFKLCHPYCNECKELGTSDDDQRYISCLPQYHLEDGQCIKDDLVIDSSTQVDSTNDLSTQEYDYHCVETGICNFDHFDNENNDFYEVIKSSKYIKDYDCGNPLIIKNSNGYFLQITTVK